MKLLLFTFCLACFTFSSTAQYKDSLKTFRKLVKKNMKSSDFVFIPSGIFNRGMSDTDSDAFVSNQNNYYLVSRTISIDSFFMEKFEVSNEKYLAFLDDVLGTDRTHGKSYLPDTLVWRDRMGFGEKYIDYYLRHPAYSDYPVVGVSYAQAKAYAEWLSSEYNSNEERVFKKVRFRLPTEEEWEWAFKGGRGYSYLPWDSQSTLDENGELRANFRAVSQLSIFRDSIYAKNYLGEMIKVPVLHSNGLPMSFGNDGVAGYLNDNGDFTTSVDAYEPNGYGLYQMSGNVKEMVDSYYFRDYNAYEFTHDERHNKSDKPWGVTKGGSWNDTGYYLQYPIRQFYTDPNFSSKNMGFRLVMEVLDY